MLTPARTAPPAAPDAPAVPGEPAAPNPRRWVLLLGLLATLAAVVFPFAPVVQPQVDYRWSAADGPAALPLMPYQPTALTATLDCAAARTAAPGAVLLSTVPARPDPAAEPLAGLRVSAESEGVLVTSGDVELGRVPLPASPCTITIASDPRVTTVRLDQAVVLTEDGDVRPAVVGAFSDLRGGVSLALTADTRFQTSITPLKAAIAIVGVLALIGMLVALHRADRLHGRRLRLPRGWWHPRLVDLAVVALLGLWWAIGAVTVDDGYIAGIIRSRGENGFIGNVYRWLNAPESPFSWFYDLLYPWSQVSASTLWMRLPATLLGLLTWVLLSRWALPRLGVRKPWFAALAFATWWIPLNLGLRPEPWVAAALLGCWLLVERAMATRRLLPLVLGLLLAGATTAITPGGLVAFAPFLAGVGPVVRLVRARTDLHRWPVAAALVATPAAAVFLMVYDQSFAAMLESTRVRSLIGGGAPWYDEIQRYDVLLTEGFQGSIGRRAAVLVTLLATAAVLIAVRRGPKHRMVLTVLLAVAVMTFTPTKWTQHFGDLAGVGAAVLVLGAATARRTVGALAATVAVCAFVVAGMNQWPFVSGWFTPTFSTLPPQIANIPVATLLLIAGAVAVAVGLVRRPVPAVPLIVVVLVFALALQVLGLARVAVAHRDGYTLASDAVATVRGDPCGLQ
ncbi:MAG: arabinosyltransferase domain-containing protein, partial [Pseudonocardia sp.]|nr:arabinosyltransferase domain-containing protein [Pseudonocardia sp.]